MSPAAETLPSLDVPVAIDAATIGRFRADGHAVVRGLASGGEVEAYREIIETGVREHGREERPLEERDTYGQAFLQVPNLWRRDERIARFVLSARFAKAAADLMGVQGVRLYHDQALFKEPGGGHTPWHQDQYYWPLDTTNTITMWMPLVDIPPEIGSMRFASGSHRAGDLGAHSISDTSESVFTELLAERGLGVETHGAMAAGDATFHAGWTLHSAGPNPTTAMRSVMTIIYFADGAHVSEPKHDHQRFDLSVWLKGLAPGDRAASPRNPRCWPPE